MIDELKNVLGRKTSQPSRDTKQHFPEGTEENHYKPKRPVI